MTPVVAGGWIRNREPWNYIGAGAAALFAAWMVFEAIHAFAVRDEPASAGLIIFASVVFATIAGSALWWGSRMVSLGVRVDPRGVTIRGVVRTRFVPMEQVKCFEQGTLGTGGLRIAYGIRLVRRDAHPLPIRALRFGEFNGKASLARAHAKWQPVCDELNALLGSLR
jgi:Bacterial PH domain